VRLVDPNQIAVRILERFPEIESIKFEAMPAAEFEQRMMVVFREPPTSVQLAEISRHLQMAVQPFLAPPSNIIFARNRAYPRLVLPPSRLAAFENRFKEAANAMPAAFLEAATNQELTSQSLPDVLVAKGLIDPDQARKLWAECIECAPFEGAELSVHPDVFQKLGACFWWLHRMLPADGELVVTASTPHPEVREWLASKTGIQPKFAAELPRRLELAARTRGIEIDPDQVLIDALARKGLLRPEQLPNILALRELTTDSASNWLVLQRSVSEEQLHATFLETSNLAVAQSWNLVDVKRLLPILPPGFSAEHACYPLQSINGSVRLGLGQMPSSSAVRTIYNRLAGYSLFFQALSYADAIEIKKAAA
jgi:hypothetical protein